jgi:hypothetical protein
MLRMLNSRVLRVIFGLKKDEVTGDGRNCILRSCMICTAHQISLG